ncbi:MAG: FecR domain-containing protein [Bacteroidota bacterium]
MKVTPDLLEKYAQGKCSPQEKAFIKNWLEDSQPEIDNSGPELTPFQENKIWDSINPDVTDYKDQNRLARKIWAVAASIALLISIGLGFKIFKVDQEMYLSGVGQTNTIVLSDGSIVTLNACSKLIIAKDFESDDRNVVLSGEGYFQVAKDSLRPFIISTPTSRTQVLGTEFNLKSYPNEAVTLTLDEGKVVFSGVGDQGTIKTILLPNEQAKFLAGHLEKDTVEASTYSGWVRDEWIFNDESFSDITKSLERKYGVKLMVNKPAIKAKTFKGQYVKPSLETLLDDMGFVLDFTYQRQGNNIIIY